MAVGAGNPTSVIERTEPELPEGKSKSKQTEIVPDNSSSSVGSSTKMEQTENVSATSGKKGQIQRELCFLRLVDPILQTSVFNTSSFGAEIPPAVERLEPQELSTGKNKSNEAEFVPEKSSIVESIKKEQTENISAITGKKGTWKDKYVSPACIFCISYEFLLQGVCSGHTNIVEWDISTYKKCIP